MYSLILLHFHLVRLVLKKYGFIVYRGDVIGANYNNNAEI